MKYRQITQEERYIISALRKEGYSPSMIAEHIGKDRSSIYRELKRNTSPDGSYRPTHAGARARVRKSASRKKSQFSKDHWAKVDDKIRQDWSPEQISFVFRIYGIMSISTEAIYLHIWKDMRSGGKLYLHLRQSQKRRRKRYRSTDSRGVLPGKRDLSQRPIEANQREEKGHFEIDLVHGYNHTDCILTLVDRLTRFLIIRKLRNKTTAEVEKQLIPIISKFQIKTITADNGTEWHGYKQIEEKTTTTWYFAEPYHSWERGTNENTNGLIRQYLPKKKSMHGLTQLECEQIAQRLNRRPRKILNFDCPETCHLGIPLMSHF
jgi:IS30 family transposase